MHCELHWTTLLIMQLQPNFNLLITRRFYKLLLISFHWKKKTFIQLYTYIQIIFFFDMRKNIFGRIIRLLKKKLHALQFWESICTCVIIMKKISKSMYGLI